MLSFTTGYFDWLLARLPWDANFVPYDYYDKDNDLFIPDFDFKELFFKRILFV